MGGFGYAAFEIAEDNADGGAAVRTGGSLPQGGAQPVDVVVIVDPLGNGSHLAQARRRQPPGGFQGPDLRNTYTEQLGGALNREIGQGLAGVTVLQVLQNSPLNLFATVGGSVANAVEIGWHCW